MRCGVVLILLALGFGAACADELEVLQVKQSFDPRSIEVASGTPVTFTNADDVKHNLKMVAPDGTQTDFGVEKPGEHTIMTFPAAGDYSVICGIHPRMKLKVTVK